MNTLTGVDLDAAVASVLGKDYPLIVQCERVRAFNPSHSRALAMQLLIDQKITLLYSPHWDEKNNEIPHWAAGWHYYDCDDFEMESEGTGATPQEAICRAILQRAENQAREAERQAAEQAENERLGALCAVAWDRANHTRATRTPWTEFANEEEQAAYRLALDQQLENIRARHAVDGTVASTDDEAKPLALPGATHPTELL